LYFDTELIVLVLWI